MNKVDKYFDIVGLKVDDAVKKYLRISRAEELEIDERIGETLGLDGIDQIMRDVTKKPINHTQGGYNLRFKILNYDVGDYYMGVDVSPGKRRRTRTFTVDNIDVAIDPKSTVTLMTNGNRYELGDLYNYSNIDELNRMYTTEDDPITEDDINEIGYEIQDVIRDWLYDNVYPVTGVEFDTINASNAGPNDLIEEMYRIKTLMNISESEEELIYSDKVDKKHQKRMDNIPNSIFSDYDYSKFKDIEHPENLSDEAKKELELLAQIEVDDSFVDEMDKVKKVYKKFLKLNEIKLNEDLIDKILDEAGAVILDLKYYFNRPRPFQLNKVHDIEMDDKMMDSMKSPSYPSGHAAQGRLIGMILSYFYPELETELMEIADDISYSRNMAKAHFPSDTEVGKKLGEDMFNYLKKTGYLDSIKDMI